MSERVFNLPNVITLLRLAAVPVVGWLILQQRWEAACWLFLAAAVSDGLDGLLALDGWRLPLFATVFVIAVASGVQYVWIWGAKARCERGPSQAPH